MRFAAIFIAGALVGCLAASLRLRVEVSQAKAHAARLAAVIEDADKDTERMDRLRQYAEMEEFMERDGDVDRFRQRWPSLRFGHREPFNRDLTCVYRTMAHHRRVALGIERNED